MFNRKSKKQHLTISVKAITDKDIEKAFGRVDSAFPDEGTGDALTAVARKCVQVGARVMADEITRGERSAEEYARMRRQIDEIVWMTVLMHASGSKSEGKDAAREGLAKEGLADLEGILKEVFG